MTLSGVTDSCPRCGFVYDPDHPYRDRPAILQMEVCAFCRENAERMVAGRRPLRVPNDEFPTWSPDVATE